MGRRRFQNWFATQPYSRSVSTTQAGGCRFLGKPRTGKFPISFSLFLSLTSFSSLKVKTRAKGPPKKEVDAKEEEDIAKGCKKNTCNSLRFILIVSCNIFQLLHYPWKKQMSFRKPLRYIHRWQLQCRFSRSEKGVKCELCTISKPPKTMNWHSKPEK